MRRKLIFLLNESSLFFFFDIFKYKICKSLRCSLKTCSPTPTCSVSW